MFCPHGHLETGACPVCGTLSNVKPLQLASRASFTSFDVTRDLDTRDAPVASPPVEQLPSLPISSLKPVRLQPDGVLRISPPGASAHLHARIAAILPPAMHPGAPSIEDVELRVKGIRQGRSHPMLRP